MLADSRPNRSEDDKDKDDLHKDKDKDRDKDDKSRNKTTLNVPGGVKAFLRRQNLEVADLEKVVMIERINTWLI